MSQRPVTTPGAIVSISVPVQGELRPIVAEVAAKIAEFLKRDADVAAFATALDALTERVAPGPEQAEVTYEFREAPDGLLIEARSGGRTSEVRCPLPA
jgi:hypothetical protein